MVYLSGSPEKVHSQVHRYLIASISNPLQDGFNIGPSEANWAETPFICGTDLCEDFQKVYYSLDMRRLRSLTSTACHKFIDFSFVASECPLVEARMNFLFSNFFLEESRSNYDKALFEELRGVDALDGGFFDSTDDDDYLDEEEARKVMGHLVIAFPHDEASLGAQLDFSSQPVRDFAADLDSWSVVRRLCAQLPPKCSFRRLVFYREVSGTSRYRFLLLAQVNRLMTNQNAALRAMSRVRADMQEEDNCGEENGNGPLVELYKELDFEVDLEALQALVAVAGTVKCVGSSLEVKFRDEPGVKKRLAGRGMRPFKPTKEVDYEWRPNERFLDANRNYLERRKSCIYRSTPKCSVWDNPSMSLKRTPFNVTDIANNNSPASPNDGRLSRLGRYIRSSLRMHKKATTRNKNSTADTGYGTFESGSNPASSPRIKDSNSSAWSSWSRKISTGFQRRGRKWSRGPNSPSERQAMRKRGMVMMMDMPSIAGTMTRRGEDENNNAIEMSDVC